MYELKIQHYSRERPIFEKVEPEALGERIAILMEDRTVQFVLVQRDQGKPRSKAPFSLGKKD